MSYRMNLDDTMTTSHFDRVLNPQAVCQAVRKRLWSRVELCFYARRVEPVMDAIDDVSPSQLLRRDCLDDLRHYRRHELEQMTAEAYWRESQRRLALGYHLYTRVQGDELIYYGWLVDRQARSEDPLMGQVFFPPPDSSIVFDCYVHPAARGRGVYSQALCRMLHDAQHVAGAGQVCMGAFADNVISRHVIEKLGFRYIGSMIKERRLWRVKRYAVAVAPEFRTALFNPASSNRSACG
jgi:RimJ/RimL family protein N-acetyltransferase